MVSEINHQYLNVAYVLPYTFPWIAKFFLLSIIDAGLFVKFFCVVDCMNFQFPIYVVNITYIQMKNLSFAYKIALPYHHILFLLYTIEFYLLVFWSFSITINHHASRNFLEVWALFHIWRKKKKKETSKSKALLKKEDESFNFFFLFERDMYTHIYICICICIYTRIHIHVHIYRHTYVCLYISSIIPICFFNNYIIQHNTLYK